MLRYGWLLLLVACTDPDVVVEDSGNAWFLAAPEAHVREGNPLDIYGPAFSTGFNDYQANGLQYVVVYGPTEGCPKNLESSCTVSREGTKLIISARASWDHPDVPVCTRQAWYYAASCFVPALPTGDYELVFGSDVMPLTIPSVVTAPQLTNSVGWAD